MKYPECEDCDKGSYSIVGLVVVAIYMLLLGMCIGGCIVGKFGAQLAALGW